MLKFHFSIQTRDGQKLNSIVIGGQDQMDAERKLRQMYRQCVILSCEVRHSEKKHWQATSVEDILTMISK